MKSGQFISLIPFLERKTLVETLEFLSNQTLSLSNKRKFEEVPLMSAEKRMGMFCENHPHSKSHSTKECYLSKPQQQRQINPHPQQTAHAPSRCRIHREAKHSNEECRAQQNGLTRRSRHNNANAINNNANTSQTPVPLEETSFEVIVSSKCNFCKARKLPFDHHPGVCQKILHQHLQKNPPGKPDPDN